MYQQFSSTSNNLLINYSFSNCHSIYLLVSVLYVIFSGLLRKFMKFEKVPLTVHYWLP